MNHKFVHYTPRYVFNRMKLWQYQKQNPDAPWLTSRAVDFFSQWLKPTDIALEWGSGRSTLWLCKRVLSLISIEHDSAWFEIVQKQLHEKRAGNVQHVLLNTQNAADSAYVHAVDAVGNASLDFVLVDGRLRAFCVLAAIEKLRPGGLLVVDNIDRYFTRNGSTPSIICCKGESETAWLSVQKRIGGWRMFWTTNGVFDTAIFWRPADCSERQMIDEDMVYTT